MFLSSHKNPNGRANRKTKYQRPRHNKEPTSMMRSRGLHHRSPKSPRKCSFNEELPETVQDVALPKPRRRRKAGGRLSRRNNKRGVFVDAVWLATGGCAALVFILHFTGIHWASQTLQRHAGKTKSSDWKTPLSSVVPPHAIVFQGLHEDLPPTTMELPHPLEEEELEEARHLDFGDIDVRIVEDEIMPRVIYKDLRAARGYSRDYEDGQSGKRIWYDYVFAFDDDNLRTPYMIFDDDTIVEETKCRRVNWHRENRMNCNNVHEIDILSFIALGESRYLGYGSFREAFLIGSEKHKDQIVFKQQLYSDDYGDEAREYMRVDSFVMDIFTSSPLFLDIYGYCALSQLIEPMPHGDLEATALVHQQSRSTRVKLDETKLDPKNSLTVKQKLTFSLEMAEAIAMLHNYPGGVIVHDDVHMGQFLLTNDLQHVKIQDFNRGEILLWSEKQNKYCTYKNGKGHGDWRSPEEYKDYPLDEKIDIWSLGNNMYSVLTGLYPFYNVHDGKEVKNLIKDKRTSWIDPRYKNHSLAERKIVEAIERCWVYNPDERASATEVLSILREALDDEDGSALKQDEAAEIVRPRRKSDR